jgi:hypothetical protein
LKVKRKFEQCIIENELANIIQLKQATLLANNPNTASTMYTTFTANLLTKNNLHYLTPAPKTIPLTRRDRLDESNNLKKYVFGKLSLEQVELNLRQSGFGKVIVKPINTNPQPVLSNPSVKQDVKTDVYSIEIDKFNSVLIDFKANSIHIFDNNEDMRNKMKDALLKCLNTF